MALSNFRILTRFTHYLAHSRHRRLLLVGLFAASFLLYSSVLGLTLGGAVMIFLLFHELGHLFMVNAFGVKNYGIIFFSPFGAGVLAEFPKNRLTDGLISLAGPLSGIMLSLVTGTAYWVTKNPFFSVVTCLIATGNLLNLFPATSHDGGSVMRSVIRSLPTATSWFATLSVSATIIGSAIALSLLTGSWFYPIILIMIGVFLNKAGRVFTRDQERLESLAFNMDVPVLKTAVEDRLAADLVEESGYGGKSLDDDESLHELLDLKPELTKTHALAKQALRGKLKLTLYDDMVPMRVRAAWLVLAGYAITVIALAVIGYASLTVPGNARAVAESMGGLVVLILGK